LTVSRLFEAGWKDADMPHNSTDCRRLAAIMFTDVAGYAALVQRDEMLALELLEEHRRLIRPLFHQFGGREVETTGDGFLAEFASALEATRCAVSIQERLAARNAREKEDRRLQIRIGIHVGDVLCRGTHLLGDAVNIAARVEPLAPPGGICITRAVQEQVANKLPNRLASLGPLGLKNIAHPVEIFQLDLASEVTRAAARKIRGAALRGRVRPASQATSVAVLPFVNMSSDRELDYWSDGMTEELTAALSRVSGLNVAARTSVFALKDGRQDIRQIGRALNVEKVVEGSVRGSAESFRITAQLINALDGFHLWSESYDREKTNPLAVQREVSRSIVEAVARMTS
jgi:adenylate cyclase